MTHVHPPRGLRLIELPNRAENTARSYRVDWSDISAALSVHRIHADRIVGFMHTHPAPFLAHPSDEDLDGITEGAPHWWHAVVHIKSATVTWYDIDGIRVKERL